MIQIKKTLLTLVALLAVTTGAWATTPNSIVINGTPQVGDKSISLTYHFDPNNVPGLEPYVPSLKVKCAADNKWDETFLSFFDVSSGTTNISLNTLGEFEAGKTYEVCFAYNNGSWVDDVFQSFVPAAVATATAVDIDWDAATKTGTFTQPAGNVTVSVEYYDLATLADKGLTAAEDAAAKTEAPLAVVADGAVTGGTLMYYVATDGDFSQDDAIALAETEWSAAIPTAETIDAAGGTCYVWYYIKGDAEHSDTDPQRLAVTVLPEPTYTVEFAEGTPESDKWKAEPNAGVKKGQTVTVTYTGSKKVLGVKAEKKAPVVYTMVSEATAEDYGKVVCAAGHLHDAKTDVPTGCTAVGILGKVTGTGHGLILALHNGNPQSWNTINGWTSVTTYAGTTLKQLPAGALGSLTSYTTLGSTTVSNWCVAQKSDYEAIFINLDSMTGDTDGTTYDDNVNAYITIDVGVSAIYGSYWSATEYSTSNGWYFRADFWDYNSKSIDRQVRPCLAF